MVIPWALQPTANTIGTRNAARITALANERRNLCADKVCTCLSYAINIVSWCLFHMSFATCHKSIIFLYLKALYAFLQRGVRTPTQGLKSKTAIMMQKMTTYHTT